MKEMGLYPGPGRKKSGFLPDGRAGETIPITVLCGKTGGPRVLVIAGIHGGEYSAIAAAARLCELSPDQICGTLAVINPVNVQAFWGRREYINPEDGKNFASVFPGDAGGTPTERVAWNITRLLGRADFLFDLHAGDLHEALSPFVLISKAGCAVRTQSLSAARAVGLERIIELDASGLPISCAAAMGVPAVMVEIGGEGKWSLEQAEDYCRRVKNALRSMDALQGESKPGSGRLLDGYVSVKAEARGCWMPAVQPGQRVEKGQLTGRMIDLYSAGTVDCHAPVTGVVLYVVTAPAVEKGGSLYALGYEAQS